MTAVIETINEWKCPECGLVTDTASYNPAYECGSCGQTLIRICSVLGCEESAIEIYQHTSVRLLGGEEIFVDLAFCLNCSVRGPPTFSRLTLSALGLPNTVG